MPEFTQHSALVLVPAFNAERHLDELIERLGAYVCPSILLFVNDGSTDGTLAKLKEREVNYISFPENRGKGAALKAGFDYAIENDYRSVLTIDADLQHSPEKIPGFYALDNGHRLVMGTRDIDLKVMPLPRWFSNNTCSLIISIFSTRRIRDSQSGYRLIPTSLLRAMRLRTVGYDFESEMLFKAGAAGYEVGEVSVPTIYEDSVSFINPLADTGRFVRQIWRRIWA
jgi:glycosyltransferase involved in cell wall biosynthesis